jgi:quercetin dioxygenase-like cupin family protein
MSEPPVIQLDQASVRSLAEEIRFVPNEIVNHVLLRSGPLRIVLFAFAEGQEMAEHSSTSQALVQILSGECEFTLEGKPQPLKAGDLLFMPAHLPHGVKATRDCALLVTLFKPEAHNS